MTLYLDSGDVRALGGHDVVLAAARRAAEAGRRRDAGLPPRIDVPTDGGFLRVMPAVVGDRMGVKVMTLVREVGTRYVVLLYGVATGELEAVVDADEVTRLRTAATTAVAAGVLVGAAPERLGLVGTGFEADGHLRVLARLWPLREVIVYGRDERRRAEFADRLSGELGIAVVPAGSAAEACSAAPVTVLATKSAVPVVDGDDFARDGCVLSIGSTRPDLRELDLRTLERTAVLLVDDVAQVLKESGDVRCAIDAGAIEPARLLAVGDALADPAAATRGGGRDLLVFKSVGTALQDLALASDLVRAAREQGRGRELGELSRLKPFATTQEAGT